MIGLIGYTGFVGSNLLKQTNFDKLYNTKNINDIRRNEFDLLVCSGAPAVKWKANKDPEADLIGIQSLIENLKHVVSKQVILISTVDVYKTPIQVNEDTPIDPDVLEPYGKHRFLLEEFVKGHFEKVHIVRLPGLFGEGLKKNIIYDFINNNSLELIHCKNIFQFYNLNNLYCDIEKVMNHNLPLVNFSTEPVSVEEVAFNAFGLKFLNQTNKPPVIYDMQSKFAPLFNDNTHDHYLITKKEQLDQIKSFVIKQQVQGI